MIDLREDILRLFAEAARLGRKRFLKLEGLHTDGEISSKKARKATLRAIDGDLKRVRKKPPPIIPIQPLWQIPCPDCKATIEMKVGARQAVHTKPPLGSTCTGGPLWAGWERKHPGIVLPD